MSKERKRILRSLDEARKGLFPHKTCPASRHVHLIVEGLLDPKTDLAKALDGFEREHLAGSIASVLKSLWSARRWMRWEPNVEADPTKGGKWVPDLDAIAVLPSRDRNPKGGNRETGCRAKHESANSSKPNHIGETNDR